ncbi:MAG: SelB C-terminal domain-containing protein, partial [Acidobacteriota bacterium]
VLDNAPAKHRRSDARARRQLEALESGDARERLATLVAAAMENGAAEEALRQQLFTDGQELEAIADELAAADRLMVVQRRPLLLLDGTVAQALAKRVVQALTAYHEEHPLASAMPKSALTAALPPRLPDPALAALLQRMAAEGVIRESADGVALPEHQVELTDEQARAREALLRLFDEARWAPPSIAEALQQTGVSTAVADAVLHMLLRSGDLVRVRNDLIYRSACLEKLIAELRERYAAGDSFSVPQFKEWTGVSRKHAIPLLEYLDQHRVTRREGDLRVRV